MNSWSETLAQKPSCKALPIRLNPFTRKSRNQVARKHLFLVWLTGSLILAYHETLSMIK